jgi:hypothetical protein
MSVSPCLDGEGAVQIAVLAATWLGTAANLADPNRADNN